MASFAYDVDCTPGSSSSRTTTPAWASPPPTPVTQTFPLASTSSTSSSASPTNARILARVEQYALLRERTLNASRDSNSSNSDAFLSPPSSPTSSSRSRYPLASSSSEEDVSEVVWTIRAPLRIVLRAIEKEASDVASTPHPHATELVEFVARAVADTVDWDEKERDLGLALESRTWYTSAVLLFSLLPSPSIVHSSNHSPKSSSSSRSSSSHGHSTPPTPTLPRDHIPSIISALRALSRVGRSLFSGPSASSALGNAELGSPAYGSAAGTSTTTMMPVTFAQSIIRIITLLFVSSSSSASNGTSNMQGIVYDERSGRAQLHLLCLARASRASSSSSSFGLHDLEEREETGARALTALLASCASFPASSSSSRRLDPRLAKPQSRIEDLTSGFSYASLLRTSLILDFPSITSISPSPSGDDARSSSSSCGVNLVQSLLRLAENFGEMGIFLEACGGTGVLGGLVREARGIVGGYYPSSPSSSEGVDASHSRAFTLSDDTILLRAYSALVLCADLLRRACSSSKKELGEGMGDVKVVFALQLVESGVLEVMERLVGMMQGSVLEKNAEWMFKLIHRILSSLLPPSTSGSLFTTSRSAASPLKLKRTYRQAVDQISAIGSRSVCPLPPTSSSVAIIPRKDVQKFWYTVLSSVPTSTSTSSSSSSGAVSSSSSRDVAKAVYAAAHRRRKEEEAKRVKVKEEAGRVQEDASKSATIGQLEEALWGADDAGDAMDVDEPVPVAKEEEEDEDEDMEIDELEEGNMTPAPSSTSTAISRPTPPRRPSFLPTPSPTPTPRSFTRGLPTPTPEPESRRGSVSLPAFMPPSQLVMPRLGGVKEEPGSALQLVPSPILPDPRSTRPSPTPDPRSRPSDPRVWRESTVTSTTTAATTAPGGPVQVVHVVHHHYHVYHHSGSRSPSAHP